jgi:multidrug efflux pump subunit AcrB
VNDIEHVESTSYNGVGIIKIFLQPGANVDGGVAQVTAIAQTVLRLMPPGQTPPLIIRYNASTVPILQYSLTSKKLSEQEVADLALNQVRIGLVNVPGAQIPWPYGGRLRTVVVDLDLSALKAKNLRAQDIVEAVNAQNLVLPSGTAKIGDTEYNIEVNSSPRVLDDLNHLPIKTINGATSYLRDVAQVRDGFNPQTNIVRMDGQRGALITILKSGFASTLEVVRRIKARMPQVLATVTSELDVKEFADQSLFVRAAINDVVKEGVIAAALTAIMILIFIGSWRSTIIIALSIPLSVIASLIALSAPGETINLMTLGGLALAVGILVDDATVESENVHRQMAKGKPLITAILDGAQEIALPAFVSTLCICIVFVPMFFLTGVARFLFVPLAEAVVFAMLASYVLSRTLIPTLVMWFYRYSPYHSHEGEDAVDEEPPSGWSAPFVHVQRAFERGLAFFRSSYRSMLGAVLARRGRFALVFLAGCVASLSLGPQLGQDFFPSVDSGQFRLHLRAPEHVMDSIGALETIPVSGGKAGEGDGQLLTNVAHLDRDVAQARAELARAEAARDLAGTTAKRWTEMLSAKTVSPQETDEKIADLALKQASVEAARKGPAHGGDARLQQNHRAIRRHRDRADARRGPARQQHGREGTLPHLPFGQAARLRPHPAESLPRRHHRADRGAEVGRAAGARLRGKSRPHRGNDRRRVAHPPRRAGG